jgi:hypothetical protein
MRIRVSISQLHKGSRVLGENQDSLSSGTVRMIFKQNVPTVLMAVILLLSLIRLLTWYHFGSKWSAYKIDYAVGTTSCILFAVLLGLFWSERSPMWSRVLLWFSTILPPLQVVRGA